MKYIEITSPRQSSAALHAPVSRIDDTDSATRDIERLRQTVRTLLMVGEAMNDAVRIWTMPTIPNN